MNKQQIEELRQKYINNPPEGMSEQDIKEMSDDDLLDMDYFLYYFQLKRFNKMLAGNFASQGRGRRKAGALQGR